MILTEKGGKKMSDMVMSVVDSPTVLVFDDCLAFDPFSCDSLEDVRSRYGAMLGGLNRYALYTAYSIGRLIDEKKLERYFKIKSIKELADYLGYSSMQLRRYRTVYELLTDNQVRRLAGQGVSINAVVKLAEISEEDPDQATKLLDALMCGELKTEKDLKQEYVRVIADRMQPKNLLPGGDPDVAPATTPIIEDVEVIDSPADAVADTVKEQDCATCDDVEDAEEVTHMQISASGDDSQNKRDIRNLMRNCRSDLAPVRRDLLSVQEDIPAQLEVLLGREDVIIGDDEAHEEYTKLLKEFFDLCQGAVEKLVPIIEEGLSRGLLGRPCVLPESTSIDRVFRKEN
jgi:hypothetical protein